VPWAPELFSAPAAERLRETRRVKELAAVPFFDGLVTGELDALIGSFAGEPELHHPVRGRIKGIEPFARFVTETRSWLADRNITVEDVDLLLTPARGIEEVILHLDSADARIGLPVAIAADHADDARITELRMYFSTWPLTGGHVHRPPLLQRDFDQPAPDVVGAYLRALAAGDVDAIVAAFEPEGSMREPAGGAHVHRGTDGLRALYELFFSEGGIALEHCTVTDDGRACALEYNIVGWGRTELSPAAGLAVYVRGDSGMLAAARVYDDADPPLRPRA
jgi:hypothetical protein